MIGTTIGSFRIIEKIGEGGMGVVYKAQDIRLDRIVALKFLPERFSVTEEERARFLQEAKAAATLNHPNVCTIHGVEQHGTQQFIQMEFVEGQTLHEIAQQGAIPPTQALDYAIQIAEALQEAHQRGIVHRDIKSENIMINTRKQVKVMDFGLAKLRGSLKLTKASSTLGTLGYMAPEQIQGNEADARADLFSFGVVLYEMLTGRLPFRGEHEAALMYSILNEDPQPLSITGGEPVPELEHIIGKALEKNPDERYQSAKDLLVDLRRARRQSGKVSHASAGAVSSQRETSPLPPQGSKKKRRVALLGGVVLIAVLVIVLLLLLPEKHRAFERIEMSRLTTSGTAGDVSISPDGKVVAHSVFQGGKSSFWVRQVATGSSVQVGPPFKGSTLGTTILPDGEFLLYGLSDQEEHPLGAVFKVPILGGPPRQLLTGVASAVGVSTDGSRLAFLRSFPSTGEEALIICSSDGSQERKLAVRDGAKTFFLGGTAGPGFSPDDRLIAVSAGSVTDEFAMGVLLVSVADGSESWLGAQNWERVDRTVWLPDGSGVIVVGSPKGSVERQLWCLDYPGGSVRRVTNDLNSYLGHSIGVTRDGRTIAAGMVQIQSTLWRVDRKGTGGEHQVTSGGSDLQGVQGIATLPDGRIIYSSTAARNLDLWIVNADGTGARQVTVDPSSDYDPAVTPDGSTVVFVSDRTGTPHLWKTRVDGTGLEQLTSKEDYTPTISPDGKWVYYGSWAGGNMNVWRVGLAGEAPEMVVSKPSWAPAISPDGTLLACPYQAEEGTPFRTAILPIEGGEPLAIFDLGGEVLQRGVRWDADGESLLHVDQVAGVYNLYAKPITGGPSRQATHFHSGVVFQFAVSTDGRSLVCARGTRNSDVVLISDVR
jgi:serine/threonine protein kinase/Tol biopolymer transport system component